MPPRQGPQAAARATALAGHTRRAVAERALASALNVAPGRIPWQAGPLHALHATQGSMPLRQGPQPAVLATVATEPIWLAVGDLAQGSARTAGAGPTHCLAVLRAQPVLQARMPRPSGLPHAMRAPVAQGAIF